MTSMLALVAMLYLFVLFNPYLVPWSLGTFLILSTMSCSHSLVVVTSLIICLTAAAGAGRICNQPCLRVAFRILELHRSVGLDMIATSGFIIFPLLGRDGHECNISLCYLSPVAIGTLVNEISPVTVIMMNQYMS